MSLDVTVLLSFFTDLNEKTQAVNNIITKFNIYLATYELLNLFDKARSDIICGKDTNAYFRHQKLFNFLLNNNIGMLVALTKFYNYDESYSRFTVMTMFIELESPFRVGHNYLECSKFIVSMYVTLLNYCDFNIDNLNLHDDNIKIINRYRKEKYGGKLTKVAN